jgi:hypothetical protein
MALMDSLHASHWRSYNRMLKLKFVASTLIEAMCTKGRARYQDMLPLPGPEPDISMEHGRKAPLTRIRRVRCTERMRVFKVRELPSGIQNAQSANMTAISLPHSIPLLSRLSRQDTDIETAVAG